MLQWKHRLAALLEKEQYAHQSGVRVWMSDAMPPDLLSAMDDEKVTPILRQIIGPEVEFLSAKVVFKNGRTRFGSPWHQDRFYWQGSEKISIWIAMDDAAPDNGCLMFIPGTHRRQYREQRVASEQGFEMRIADDDLRDLPSETIAVKRGGAVFFSDLAVHGSHPNSSGADRWAMISTYRDASVRDESTVWKHPMRLGGRSTFAT
jgi:ectoine hydroxylase-related dioxygenase (phytanoyl-CoA dioxygenase family)